MELLGRMVILTGFHGTLCLISGSSSSTPGRGAGPATEIQTDEVKGPMTLG